MSTTSTTNEATAKPAKRLTVRQIASRKGGEPIVCLTAYSAQMAALMDDAVDLILVGDSMGMVQYGMPSTIGVTLDMVINHGKAVVRGSRKACVIIDMPFGSFEESPEVAFRNCARVMMETGAQGVKLEGGRDMAETIRFLTRRAIPVMGHVGLRPQSVNVYGGFCAQGRTEAEWQPIIDDAAAVADAGAFATVLEGVAEPLARKLTEVTRNPIIGIGASSACDGQILVAEDMLGLFPGNPRFVKRYAEIGETIREAVGQYASDVRARSFPAAEQTYGMKK